MLLPLFMFMAALAEPVPASPPVASTPPAPPVAQAAAAAPAAKGSRVVCRQSEETGTRLGGSRVCMTVDQWRQQDSDLRQELTRGQNGILHR